MERVSNTDHPLSSSPTKATTPSANKYRQCHRFDNAATTDGNGGGQHQQDEGERHHGLMTSHSSHHPGNNHPNHDNHSNNHFVARSPAASLIQSAARSALLDESTPNSTVISDDASENGSATIRSNKTSVHLKSLQTQTLPALPDEQDRRRFIGCLAAVLASSYEFDVVADDNEDVLTDVSSNAGNESVWLGYADDFWEEDEENDGLDKNVNDKTKVPDVTMLEKTESTSESFYSTRCQSFESLGTQESSHNNVSNRKNQSSARRSRKRQTESSAKLQRKPSLFGNKAKEKARLSKERHRHRRYEVLSKLLMSSSELLLMDKMVARAFLPMLSRVLVPECRQLQKSGSMNCVETSRKGENGSKHASRSAPSSPTQGLDSKSISLNSSFDVERMLSSSRASLPTTATKGKTHAASSEPEHTMKPLPVMPLDNENELKPFLESLTPGAGFRCVALLLLQHLLTSEVGYDARVRHVLKKLSVIVLIHDMQKDPIERHYEQDPTGSKANQWTKQEIMLRATRKFEAIERSLAQRLIRLSNHERNGRDDSDPPVNGRRKYVKGKGGGNGITREQIVRGVKIGGAGIVAGTLFALTGGLAAPGIAAGIAAVAGAAAGTAAVATLTSAAVVTTIFGVGGGGLAAYKMQRRTQGLTEFEFVKETGQSLNSHQNTTDERHLKGIDAELFSVLCISGWLRDRCDYQRPWGLQPTNPSIKDKQELLERFYFIYSPEHLPKVTRILESWKGQESELWKILKEKYGCDPDHLFPLSTGPKIEGALTLEQEEILEKLFVELGYSSVAPDHQSSNERKDRSPLERLKRGWNNHKFLSGSRSSSHWQEQSSVSYEQSVTTTARGGSSLLYTANERDDTKVETKLYKPPQHLGTVWDWKMTYGGEMYHVKWESELLKRICDCFIDLAMDVVSGATKQILKQTVFHTLLAAVVWPSYLLTAADMIDGDWTLAVERADEAGKVLAKALLFSKAGRRPVTLVGYSFGGRIIFACLKELARYQEEWETYQEMLDQRDHGGDFDHSRMSKYESKMKGMREPASIVEDVVLMGLPNHLSFPSWRACRQIVSGRLVNCYSRKDLILSLMFQAKRFSGGSLSAGVASILKPVCGTCPVNEPGIENIDCTDIILGHGDYCVGVGKILERIRFGQPMRCRGDTTGLSMLPSDETEPAAELSETARRLDY